MDSLIRIDLLITPENDDVDIEHLVDDVLDYLLSHPAVHFVSGIYGKN